MYYSLILKKHMVIFNCLRKQEIKRLRMNLGSVVGHVIDLIPAFHSGASGIVLITSDLQAVDYSVDDSKSLCSKSDNMRPNRRHCITARRSQHFKGSGQLSEQFSSRQKNQQKASLNPGRNREENSEYLQH